MKGPRLGPGPYPVRQWLTAYSHGDVNRHQVLDDWRRGTDGWMVQAPKAGPYLIHVRSLANQWPHLELLADFMDVGTHPIRWNSKAPGGYPDDPAERDECRRKRMRKTNVCLLEYPRQGSGVETKTFNDSTDLQEFLSDMREDESVKTRLFVVEDLSRNVIEALGYHFKIDPSFFREHIVDYAWYNTSDWWRDPPNLDIVSRGQNWFQLRYVRARNFLSNSEFQEGVEQSKYFNVFRRLDRDFNSNNFWDKHGKDEAKVGLTRSRATCWIQSPDKKAGGITYGILLLDPTVRAGNPLWLKHRNWARTPPVGEPIPKEMPPSDNFFEDFLYWARKPDVFNFQETGNSSSPICVPTQALLHLVCNEWLTMVDYIKTRLNQVDWGIAFPDDFLEKEEQIDEHLTKLHHWRRVVPLYREMIADTFLRVFRETAHPNKMHPGRNIHEPAHKPASALATLMNTECINAYQQDFALVLGYMEEFQARIDRLTDVVTAVINMGDSRRGYKDNKNLQWLTWLATFFIPLSFVATLLSMTTDSIENLGPITRLWAIVAIPAGLVIMIVVGVFSVAKWRRAIRKFWSEFPWFGESRPFKPKRT
ncbi:hypothetical protein J7T55_004286 [Diaporthe amygdali]|uniref:uncharacterized protein n=1 Tax=Phomopsis amygdali TaxID=1214568 RepID=UPI0022FF3846|nr:uncharacterized protein J7T55_004286 [Diaporthe amygdali]KAJ0109737.1 hypothetical protein J7T55_004286 [Diaporthe amygdali]